MFLRALKPCLLRATLLQKPSHTLRLLVPTTHTRRFNTRPNLAVHLHFAPHAEFGRGRFGRWTLMGDVGHRGTLAGWGCAALFAWTAYEYRRVVMEREDGE